MLTATQTPKLAPTATVGLLLAALDYVAEAYAENTVAAYRERLLPLSAAMGSQAELNDYNLSICIRELGNEYSYNTISQTLSAVRTCARYAGVADPVGSQTELERRKLVRRKATPKQATGIVWEDADRLCEQCETEGTLVGLRDAAMISIASDGLLRSAELVALDVADIHPVRDGRGVATIRQSKTDQTGEGIERGLRRRTMQRIAAYLQEADISSGPLIRGINNGKTMQKALSSDRVCRILKARGLDILNLQGCTSHSLRVGSAQSLAERNVEMPQLKQAGGWKSDVTAQRYIKQAQALKSPVLRLRDDD